MATYYYNPLNNPSALVTITSGDASDIMYTGPILTNLNNLPPNTNLQDALSYVNTAVGNVVSIDWNSFNYGCLTHYTTAQGFVEGISSYVCTLNTNYNNFVSNTYTTEIGNINSTVDQLVNPDLTSCTAVGITESDTSNTVLSKIITYLCSLEESIFNPSTANWNQCFTVTPLPETIVDAFNVVIDQICTLNTDVQNIPVLPTFNNIGSCLPAPLTATDTLYDTVNKIKQVLCTLPSFNINNVNWTSCITNPNPGGGSDITSALSQIVSLLTAAYSLRAVSWDSSYFTVSQSTPGDSCSGYAISLNSDLGITDKFVALNSSDTNPDYLLNKMTAGSLISFDTTTTPGTVIINSTAVDNKVKADAGDASSDYLINKVNVFADSSSAVTLTKSYNATTDTVDITPSINYTNLATYIISAISGNDTLISNLCAVTCNCNCGTTGRTFKVIITNPGDSPDAYTSGFTIAQNNPSLTFFSVADISVPPSTSITSGSYAITSTDTTLTGTITITNSNAYSVGYHIYVKDQDGVTVTGSSDLTGNILSSGTYTNSSFTFGSGASQYVLHIEVEKQLV